MLPPFDLGQLVKDEPAEGADVWDFNDGAESPFLAVPFNDITFLKTSRRVEGVAVFAQDYFAVAADSTIRFIPAADVAGDELFEVAGQVGVASDNRAAGLVWLITSKLQPERQPLCWQRFEVVR